MYRDHNDREQVSRYDVSSYARTTGTGTKRKAPRNKRRLNRTARLIASAMLFGCVAGGAFYGTQALLQGNGTAQIQQEESAVVATNAAYTAASTAYTGQSLDVSAIAAQGLKSVVSVTNISVQEVGNYFGQYGRNGRGQTQTTETVSCGSGVIIQADASALYMVTNYHVVEGASTLSVTFADDQTYQAQLCGYDEQSDLAVLKVNVADLSSDTLSQIAVATIGDSDELVVGEQVVAIGNALGYGQSVTTGIASAVNRTISSGAASATYIQTDAAINPGNSGGALLNMQGELIGINTAKISSTDIEGMGYAIPITQVMEKLQALMA